MALSFTLRLCLFRCLSMCWELTVPFCVLGELDLGAGLGRSIDVTERGAVTP